MAACNPFNVLSSKKQHDDELECQFEEKEQRNRRLSHRVNPLKPSLLDIVWDFEALNKEKEKKYIALMIKADGDYKDSLIECVFICHCFIKYEIEKNKSSVSLRDIERVNKIFHFAVVLLGHVTSESESDFDRKMEKYQKKYPKIEIGEQHFLEALFITIAVNYYFRLYKESRLRLRLRLITKRGPRLPFEKDFCQTGRIARQKNRPESVRRLSEAGPGTDHPAAAADRDSHRQSVSEHSTA